MVNCDTLRPLYDHLETMERHFMTTCQGFIEIWLKFFNFFILNFFNFLKLMVNEEIFYFFILIEGLDLNKKFKNLKCWLKLTI